MSTRTKTFLQPIDTRANASTPPAPTVIGVVAAGAAPKILEPRANFAKLRRERGAR